MNKDERTKLEQQIAFNEKEKWEYIMRASKTIILILHRGFEKIKQDCRVMVIDEKSAEKLYNRLHLVKSDERTYKIFFEKEGGKYEGILSPTNRWLVPDAYLRIFGKKFMKDIGFDVNKPKSGTKSKIPKRGMEQLEQYIDEMYDNTKQFARELLCIIYIGFDVNKPKSGTKSKIPKRGMEQLEQYIDEMYDNTKQFARELNELPTSEDNQDNIMLQDIITKNETATDNSLKLIETLLTEMGEDASTQTGGLTLRELEGLDKELRTISGSLRSAIAKSIAKQVDIDREY